MLVSELADLQNRLIAVYKELHKLDEIYSERVGGQYGSLYSAKCSVQDALGRTLTKMHLEE